MTLGDRNAPVDVLTVFLEGTENDRFLVEDHVLGQHPERLGFPAAGQRQGPAIGPGFLLQPLARILKSVALILCEVEAIALGVKKPDCHCYGIDQ